LPTTKRDRNSSTANAFDDLIENKEGIDEVCGKFNFAKAIGGRHARLYHPRVRMFESDSGFPLFILTICSPRTTVVLADLCGAWAHFDQSQLEYTDHSGRKIPIMLWASRHRRAKVMISACSADSVYSESANLNHLEAWLIFPEALVEPIYLYIGDQS
jgi:hypothetical protein